MDDGTDELTPNWDARCAGCDLRIGSVEDGRFAHDPACRQPLRIERGALACCHCGGPLEARPRAAVERAVDSVPVLRPAAERQPRR